MTPTIVNSLKDLKQCFNHPYRSGEYLIDQDGAIYPVMDTDQENEYFIEEHIATYGENTLSYAINWEGGSIFTECGEQIESVY